MTTAKLFALMSCPMDAPNAFVTIQGVYGAVMGVVRESGDGRCFNVTLMTVKGKVTVFVRCVA